MKFHKFLFLVLACLLVLQLHSSVFADDAAVLPEGRFRVRLLSTYTELDNRYNAQGEINSLGATFTRSIDGKLLSALSQKSQLADVARKLNAVQAGLGDSLLSEQIAQLRTDITSTVFANTFVLEYGLTDRLSAGIIIPLVHADVEVNATSTTNSAFQQKTNALPEGELKAVRSALKDGTSLNALNKILQDQFKYSDGLKSWSGTGIGDIEIGTKYNYFREHPLKATLKSGARLATGREDDPNQLFDVAFGDGQFDLAVFHYVDYDLLPSVSITWESGYTVQLPDSGDYRVPLSADLPIGSSAIHLDRKLGDYWEQGVEANFSPTKSLILSAKYRFKQKFEDSYTSDDAINTSLLEADTASILHEGNFQIEYTNLHAVRSGTERIPFGVIAFYRLPFAGENISDSRTVGLQLKTYF